MADLAYRRAKAALDVWYDGEEPGRYSDHEVAGILAALAAPTVTEALLSWYGNSGYDGWGDHDMAAMTRAREAAGKVKS